MKACLSMCAGLSVLSAASFAVAGVIPGAPFPPTSPGFTCQSWEFLTPSMPQPADPGWINPFGVPEMRVKGFPQWLPAYPPPPSPGLKEGVWCLTNSTGTPVPDSLNFLIPNANRLEDQKEIIVFVKWTSDQPTAGIGPGYQMITPNNSAPIFSQPFMREPAGPNHPGWFIDTVRFTLPKCPPWEEIKVGAFDTPPGVNVYVDWCAIYTRCIPTPGGVSMLVLAGLAASRRRRH